MIHLAAVFVSFVVILVCCWLTAAILRGWLGQNWLMISAIGLLLVGVDFVWLGEDLSGPHGSHNGLPYLVMAVVMPLGVISALRREIRTVRSMPAPEEAPKSVPLPIEDRLTPYLEERLGEFPNARAQGVVAGRRGVRRLRRSCPSSNGSVGYGTLQDRSTTKAMAFAQRLAFHSTMTGGIWVL